MRAIRKRYFILVSYALLSVLCFSYLLYRRISPKYAGPIKILFYTDFFGRKPWQIYPGYDFARPCRCALNDCQVTYDVRDYHTSHVIMFHGKDLPEYLEIVRLHEMKRENQVWGYFSMEMPMNSPDMTALEHMFDFSSTYHMSSDVRTPYRLHYSIKKNNQIKINYFKQKTKSVAWLVSNCNSHLRNRFASSLLANGVRLEVAGDCAVNYNATFQCKSSCDEELSKFKFYFAVENGFCEDYLTEKYWERSIDINVIPIVLGGANYASEKIAIPGSYINAFDFNSPKELAEYIKKVDQDEDLYNSYFDWKNTWHVLPKGCLTYICDLCEKIRYGVNKEKKRIGSYFSPSSCNDASIKFLLWIKK